MLDELTILANKEYFIIVLQHGGNDVTCKRSILHYHPKSDNFTMLYCRILPFLWFNPSRISLGKDWVHGTYRNWHGRLSDSGGEGGVLNVAHTAC